LRWKLVTPITGVKLVDGLPFARTLPPGLTPREVAFQFAKDWTAMKACIKWGPEGRTLEELQARKKEETPIADKCGKAVFGTPGKWLTPPLSILWNKYTSYGADLRHRHCPEQSIWEWRSVCAGFSFCISPGAQCANRVDLGPGTGHSWYELMTLEFGGEKWQIEMIDDLADFERFQSWIDPSSPKYNPGSALRFSQTPMSPSFWEYPGCPLLKVRYWWDGLRSCDVYVASISQY